MDILPANCLLLLIAGLLGFVGHTLKQLVAFRTANPLAINSYFSGNWPQLGLAIVLTLGVVLGFGGADPALLTPQFVFVSAFMGASMSDMGAQSWGEPS